MTQFLRDQASDSEEVVTPLMLDGTYLSRNFATLGPLDSRRVFMRLCGCELVLEAHIRTFLGGVLLIHEFIIS